MTCYVYVLGDDGGPWKIGHSSRPEARARDVLRMWPGNQMASRRATVVFKRSFPDRVSAARAERVLHRQLEAYRCPKLSRVLSSIAPNKLEWFNCDLDTIKDAIATSFGVSYGGLKKAVDRYRKQQRMKGNEHEPR